MDILNLCTSSRYDVKCICLKHKLASVSAPIIWKQWGTKCNHDL